MGGTSAWFYKGNYAKELRNLKAGMDKIATKAALKPLSAALASAALELGVEGASKLAPAATMYGKSSPTLFRVGTTQKGAAAHQFGATIYPKSTAAHRELGRRLAMQAAREALAKIGAAGGKTHGARQFVRDAGRAGKAAGLGDAVTAYLTFRIAGRWVRVKKVKLPKRPIFPLDGLPQKWEARFESVANAVVAGLLGMTTPDRNIVSGMIRSKGG